MLPLCIPCILVQNLTALFWAAAWTIAGYSQTGPQSYEEVDESAGKLAAPFGAMVPSKCRTAALQLICQGSFPVCVIGSPLAGTWPARVVRASLSMCLVL